MTSFITSRPVCVYSCSQLRELWFNDLSYEWESDENRSIVRQRVSLLLRGCSCTSVTACTSKRCGCVKKGLKCGAGCHCKNCGNIQSECVDGSPIRRQLPSQECQVVEEEESMYDTQLREQGGDKLVYLDEE